MRFFRFKGAVPGGPLLWTFIAALLPAFFIVSQCSTSCGYGH